MGLFDHVVKHETSPPLLEVVGPAAQPGTATAYASRALELEAAAVRQAPEGTRNDALNRAAFRLGRHVGAGNIDRETVRVALNNAARAAGLPQHEIDVVLRDDTTSALSNGEAVPRHPQPRPEGEGVPAVTVLEDVPDLAPDAEDAFWKSRPLLEHVHTFARARMVAPWAVLGCVLARIITATPHQVSLPPVIGSKGSLNLFVGLVGPSGSGKGAAEAVAAEAVSVGYIESHNVGSGEGIAHGFKRREKGELVWNDDKHAILFSVPEIDSLAAQGDRKGATLMPQLRSGWTGEGLGFGYADPTRRLLVEAHQYRLCLVAGIQPGRAACLLDDADGGTPQRFLWMPATDPNVPDEEPEAPPPMSWEPPPTSSLVSINGIVVEVCQLARTTIKVARRARLRGDGTALDGHALLAQLKTAAALGIADGRYSVSEEDWRLAGVIAAKSAATRSSVARLLAERAEKANVGKALAEAERAVVVVEKVTDAAVRRVCKVVVRRLRRAGDWMSLGDLRRSVSSSDRVHVEAALERLLEAGQIVVETVDRGHRYRLPEEAS